MFSVRIHYFKNRLKKDWNFVSKDKKYITKVSELKIILNSKTFKLSLIQ